MGVRDGRKASCESELEDAVDYQWILSKNNIFMVTNDEVRSIYLCGLLQWHLNLEHYILL